MMKTSRKTVVFAQGLFRLRTSETRYEDLLNIANSHYPKYVTIVNAEADLDIVYSSLPC
ncbi:MAG: hypothetical protein QW579_01040 [Desulfurococcaceae archaeon]